MGGGLLNLVCEGNKNLFLNGNPKKTFFETKFKKYTNFGMEKMRLDVNGSRNLNMKTESQFTFNVKNYGDLLIDSYFVVTLPNIWSPIVEILPPPNNFIDISNTYKYNHFIRNIWPYEFKWIENLGSQMIKKVRYYVGNILIQEFTGNYLYNMVNRDFTKEKKELFDEMTGNTKELNDPANYGGRNNNYPNSIYNSKWQFGSEPSIRSRKIYIPLNIWSTLNNKLAFPLVSLSKNNLKIEITCRSIQELFVVRYIPTPNILNEFNELMIRIDNDLLSSNDIDSNDNNKWNSEKKKEFIKNSELIGKYIQTDQNDNRYLFYRFVNQPISPPIGADENDLSGIRINNGTLSGTSIDAKYYSSTKSIWNSDIHLLCNYVFLSEDEREVFKNRKQQYLVKFIDESDHLGLKQESIIRLRNYGLVSSWMWFFQRSDIKKFNEWSNYTNWESNNLPFESINNLINNYLDINNESLLYNILGDQMLNKNGIANLNYVSLNNFSYHTINEISNNNIFKDKLKNFLKKNKYSNKFINDLLTSSYEENKKLAANVGFEYGKVTSINFKHLPNPYNISGPLHKDNNKDILKSVNILIDGKIRENTMTNQIYNYIEPYLKSNGSSKNGLFCYNFCLNTDPFNVNPNGAINLSKFKTIEMQINLNSPKKNPNASTKLLVNEVGDIIGINDENLEIFSYTYKMHFMQERYILLEFEDGNLSLNNLI